MTARLGFLGTGWIGRHRMAATLAAGANAVAICEPGEDALAAARELAPDAAVAPDLPALLAHGLDGLVIATPSALHAEQTIASLDAGVAVFCQKPLGRTAAEAQACVDAAREGDRLLGVDLSYRFTSGAAAIRERVAAGDLGQVFAADLVFHNAYGPDKPWFYDPALSGGGCVADLGVHLVDLALWTLGWPEVADVRSHLLAGGKSLRDAATQVEDYAVATITLATGAVIRLACSWKLPAGQEAVIGASLYGTAAGAEFRNVGGSFYDFEANLLRGTAREPLASGPEKWGGRAAADWTRRLAAGERFDPEAERLIDVARVLDRIYGRA